MEGLNVELDKNTTIAKSLELAEGLTSNSSNFNSINSSDSEEEEGEQVNQLIRRKRKLVDPEEEGEESLSHPIANPIVLLSSDPEDSNNLSFDLL